MSTPSLSPQDSSDRNLLSEASPQSGAAPEGYESPRLVPLGNLRELLAGKSRPGSDFGRPNSLK